jgi:CelD/BcsL family acetyltransferase involved in cellulose biosynthesis
LTFEIAETPEQVGTVLQALIRQKTHHHRDTRTASGFDRPGYENFVREASRCLPKPYRLHLSALKSDDTIIAAHWGYVVGSRFYHLLASYEVGTWRPFSPGHVLNEYLLKWSFAQGLETFDFGFGDQSYKYQYCDVIVPLHVATIPMTFKGLVYSMVLNIAKKLKRSLKGTRAGEVLRSLVRKGSSSEQDHINPQPDL